MQRAVKRPGREVGPLRFVLQEGAEAALEPEIVVVAGYTGRDRDNVLAHIHELESAGVAPPETIPSFYLVSPALVTQSEVLVTTEPSTSGEAEFALVVEGDRVLVTLASDHTDRGAERLDVALSKRACPKVVGRAAWLLGDVIDHWDELQLRSWIGDDSLPYQDGAVSSLLEPLELLASIPWDVRPASFVLLCGTVATLGGIRPSGRFRAALEDPRTGRSIGLDYRVEVRAYLRPARSPELRSLEEGSDPPTTRSPT